MSRRVLFVCLGNICRSPLAEGVMRHLAEASGVALGIDSAGTGAWHAGEAPDRRSREVARRHGVSLDGQRARQVELEDFHRFDLIVAMDADNLADLEAMRPEHAEVRLARLRDWDPEGSGDVPDPYYGGAQGFEDVYRMVERSCAALLGELRS